MKQIFLLSFILCSAFCVVYGDYDNEYNILQKFYETHSHAFGFVATTMQQSYIDLSETIYINKESIDTIKREAIDFVSNTSIYYPNEGFDQINLDIENKAVSANNEVDQIEYNYILRLNNIQNDFDAKTTFIHDILYDQANAGDLNAQERIVILTDETAYKENFQTNFNNARESIIQLQTDMENELVNYLYQYRYEVALIVLSGSQYLPPTSDSSSSSRSVESN